jgi:hypothetical protein
MRNSFFSITLLTLSMHSFAGSVYVDGQKTNLNFQEFEFAESGDIYLKTTSGSGGGGNNPPPATRCDSRLPSDVVNHDDLIKGTTYPPVFSGWGKGSSQKWVLIPTGPVKTVAIPFNTTSERFKTQISILGQIPGTTSINFEVWISECPGGPTLSSACSRTGNGLTLFAFMESSSQANGCKISANRSYYLNIRRKSQTNESQCSTAAGKYCYTKAVFIYGPE